MRAFRVIRDYPLHVLTAAALGFTAWVGRDLTAAPAGPGPAATAVSVPATPPPDLPPPAVAVSAPVLPPEAPPTPVAARAEVAALTGCPAVAPLVVE
jgi:hypothetical protein